MDSRLLPVLLLAAICPLARAQEAADEDPSVRVAVQLQEAFAAVADRVFPSVVSISSFTRDAEWTAEKLRATRGPAWLEAHREALLYPGYRRTGAGSGFVVDGDGHILSSHGVVLDEHGAISDVLDVELEGDLHVPALVVGAEPTLDLAVLKIDVATGARPVELHPARLGDSDAVRTGYWAIALGDPRGAARTYEVGTVSTPPQRQCYQQEPSRTLIQSSVRMHPEGFGGPLVDIHGDVIGINVHTPREVEPPSGDRGSQYALPINLALQVYEVLKVKQSRRSPWLGVSVLELTLLSRKLHQEGRTVVLPETVYYPGTGVWIDAVVEPSPASRAGIRVGDFLVKMDGRLLFSVLDFQRSLYMSGIGATIAVELFRDGRTLEKTVTIEARPDAAGPGAR